MSCVDYLMSKADDLIFKFYSSGLWAELYSIVNLGLAKSLEVLITIFKTGHHSPFQTLLQVVRQMRPRQQEELNWLEVQLLAIKKTTKHIQTHIHTHTQTTNKKNQYNMALKGQNITFKYMLLSMYKDIKKSQISVFNFKNRH